ncbi:hypothetical protein AB0869_00930 [Micromonospora vinacea]|uniref:hypothetical protein n=1 Tax=Micromonospora vinacea TaxID=709878 RepID=UPI00345161FE
MPKDYTKLATDYLDTAVRMTEKIRDPDADYYLRYGQALANLAVTWELRKLREAINGVEDALEDQDGHGVGTHVRHAAEYLEKIAKQ